MMPNRICQNLLRRTSMILLTSLRNSLQSVDCHYLAAMRIDSFVCNGSLFIGARTFGVSSSYYGRKADTLKNFEQKASNYSEAQMMYARKSSKKKPDAKKRKDELKTKLDSRLERDQLEQKIQEKVELIREKLKLDEKGVISVHDNINYLLSAGLPFNCISRVADKAPRVLKIDLAILKKRIKVFKINSIYEESMVKMFKKNPAILRLNIEDTLSQKVEAIRGLNLGLSVYEIAGILERCPDIIEYLSTANLVEKMTFFKEKIGLTQNQIRKMLIKNPAVLTMKKESVKEKIDFCLANFNVTLDQISKYPRVLQCPMARMKERYFFLKQENLSNEDTKIKGWAFKALSANSDVYFASKIAQTPLKKFRDFQSKFQIEKQKAI